MRSECRAPISGGEQVLPVLPIEVDAVALADALIEARLIDPNMVDDRTALAKATARLLEIFCKEKTK